MLFLCEFYRILCFLFLFKKKKSLLSYPQLGYFFSDRALPILSSHSNVFQALKNGLFATQNLIRTLHPSKRLLYVTLCAKVLKQYNPTRGQWPCAVLQVRINDFRTLQRSNARFVRFKLPQNEFRPIK